MFVASLKLWLKNFKGPRHGLRLKFQFLFMKWITCSFWMIGKNISYKRDIYRGKNLLLCNQSSIHILILFTNNVKYGITISLPKWLVANQINWYNVFIKLSTKERIDHSIETHTNTTHVDKNKTRAMFTKHRILNSVSFTFQFWRSIKNANFNHFSQ